MRSARILVIASALLATITGTAWSQSYFTPFIGYNFGGNSANCESLRNCNDKRTNLGVSVGKTNGVFGVEQDIAYVRHFGNTPDGARSSMLTLMSSLLVVAPLGPLQPYGLFGLGLMRPNTSAGAKNAIGYDIGAGLTVFPTQRIGLRADMRRMRSFRDVKLFVFSGEKLEFWRASLGLTLR
jgi:opacity protein-like surface antigen